MTDITELAQSHELLIANGQQTADLLRHLADNEIDSDYFAVVSECESYGKETDAELSITEFALRAAGYVDALVEALEKAQQLATQQGNIACALFDEVTAQRQRIAELESQLKAAENNEIDARCHIADLESRTVKLPKPHAHLIWIQAGHAPDDYWDDVAVSHSEKDLCCDGSERYPVYARWEIEEMLAAAGIKVETE
ncbi:nucleotide exchange factor GrpE [Klebsiella quasipneumoniae]|uniref:hypothetical protein n=1 Tax=Klebsiella quasipneumoniae TaxID=1463165 RepID=UPI00292C92D4|nr:hypothetical protein [Klebsiella quasipneumoniae]MDV0545881.1 hypothetical protein [Klebsiella quasipneumoniae subsp. similipneumoniae]